MRYFAAVIAVILLLIVPHIPIFSGDAAELVSEPPGVQDSGSAKIYFEEILLSPVHPSKNALLDWRSLTLNEIRRYENFIRKFPDSDIVPTAKLMIMRLYLDVEKEEARVLRKKEFDCWNNSLTQVELKRCSTAVRRELTLLGSWSDPVYIQRAEELAEKLISQYGRSPVYRWHPGYFRVELLERKEEDLGAWVLFWLAEGVAKDRKYNLYQRIIKEKYRLDEATTEEVKKFAEDFKK